MMKYRLLLLFLLFTTTFLFSQSEFFKLENYIKEYQRIKEVPSVTAGILLDNKIYWNGSYGYADIENLVPSSTKSVYRIASISKPITAVAIMQLVERGKINLDEDITKYVTYYPKKRWKVTVRNLLNHTAGIRNYLPGEFDSKAQFSTIREAVAVIAKDSLMFEPGTRYSYNTLSYNLLAAAIETVTGKTFGEYLRQNIFEPAKMYSTFLEFQPAIVMNRAKGYIKNDFREFQNAPLADLSNKYPGGGMISTVEDLLRFAQSLLNETILSNSSFELMATRSKLKNGREIQYGLGFQVLYDEKERRVITHSGGGTGFTSMLQIYPELKVVTSHLINIRDRNLNRPSEAIFSIVIDKEEVSIKTSTADAMNKIIRTAGIDSAISFYNYVKVNDTVNYILNEEELNFLGYDLLSLNWVMDAIEIFKLNRNEYPDYAGSYLGLGDAYLKDKNKGLAIRNYRKVLQLEPNNRRALDALKKLE